jgi:hypothetical protein
MTMKAKLIKTKESPSITSKAKRDQPWMNRLFYWDNQIVAHAGKFFFMVNLRKETAVPIHFVGNRDLVSLTTALGKPYALGKEGDSYVLFSRSGKYDWKRMLVPPITRKEYLNSHPLSKREMDMMFIPPDRNESEVDEYFAAVGSDRHLVILGKTSFALYDGNSWISRGYSRIFHPHYGDKYCIWKGAVYVGRNCGEFGGGLYALNLSTGKWRKEKSFFLKPVTDVLVGPDKALWVVCGLSHLGSISGRLSQITEKGVLDLLNVSGFFERREADSSWTHAPASFAALSFNERREPLLLTEHLGIMVKRGDQWERLTSKWLYHAYLTSLLVINSEQYLIGTFDAGLLFLDTRQNKEKIIRFATSFFEWEGKEDIINPREDSKLINRGIVKGSPYSVSW